MTAQQHEAAERLANVGTICLDAINELATMVLDMPRTPELQKIYQRLQKAQLDSYEEMKEHEQERRPVVRDSPDYGC